MTAPAKSQSDPVEDFFRVLWWTVSRLPRTLLWVALWVLWWAPWGDSGRGPVDSLLFVLIGLVFITGVMFLVGVVIRPVRALMWLVTPWGDLRRLFRGTGGVMRPVVEGFGLLDRDTGKPVPGVKVSADRQEGVYSLAWPTGHAPATPESLDRLALGEYGHLGACRHTVDRERGRWVVTWYRDALPDPLAGVRPSLVKPGPTVSLGPIRVGRLLDGSDATIDIREAAHLALQGMTRSGKSALMYGILGQWACVRRSELSIWGSDPNQVLLRPWLGRADRLVLGSKPQEVLRLLDDAVTEMDRRMELLGDLAVEALDDQHFGSVVPLLVVVLEEWPSTVRAAAKHDAGVKPAERIAPSLKAAYGRLLSEGAKVGIRLVIIAQRASTEVIDGDSRGQVGTRITMGVDNRDAVTMLHPMATPEEIEAATLFTRGRCLWGRRGAPLTVCQTDLTEYADYLAAVKAAEPASTGAPVPEASESTAG